MSVARRLLLLTAIAAAAGGIAGAISVVLRDAVDSPPPVEIVGRDTTDPANPPVDPPPEHAVTAEQTISLTQRIDSRDADERHALALEMLRTGPAALPQARALRPESREGRDLQANLVSALQKMRALRRGGDYARLEEYLRLRLDLDTFATVVPDEHLREERLAYWERALEAVRSRAESGHAADGEVALTELELARVRRDLGTLDAAAYADVARSRLSDCYTWLAAQRERRDVSPAQIRHWEEQIARLEP